MKAGRGSKMIRKEGGESVFSINSTTLNCVLAGIQNYLDEYWTACVESADNSAAFRERLKP